MFLLSDRLLLRFRFRYAQDQEHVLAQNRKVEDQPWLRVQTLLLGQNFLDAMTLRLAA